jgi:sterol desaturase/sphingolipid hydroxylase (fatty acid hydroxylase superfamily)
MKRWNFNVTFPVFDAILGTSWSPEREAEVDHKRRARRGEELPDARRVW